ncbi:DUF2470 domain-containing protein [Actinoplanes sp. NPDC049316]|uniref:DUF2470 domain-containing protein n=1 Tax=Actinoplanes sp. NPDC049316 TaxID=3154727 RepID=UPI003421A870
MQPTHAELARTIAAGHLPATAHIACHPGPLPVRHVTDARGRVLLLSPAGGSVAEALRPAPDTGDTALVLDIPDVPPVAGAPALGRVWVSGWATPLTGEEARRAALDYADTDAAADLLDVGTTQVIHRMDVAEVRHERHGVLIDVDLDEYAEATPDPLHVMEFDLIADLAGHHAAEMAAYVRRRLGPAARSGDEPRVVRLDRYGFVVRMGARLARLAFPRPVADRHDLAHLLHPVLCHRCVRHDRVA